MSNVAMYEELEAGINVMLMCDAAAWLQASEGQPSEDQPEIQSDVREMLAIAAELRQLPRPEFRTRLATELTWQAAGRPITLQAKFSGKQRTFAGTFARKEAGVLPTILSHLTASERGSILPTQGRSLAASVALHVVMACLAMMSFITYKTVHIAQLPVTNPIELTAYKPDSGIIAPSGGGGGGDASKVKASGGTAPQFADEQITPPVVVLPNQHARLAVEPTIVAPEMNLPKSAQNGDPLSTLMIASNGTGVRGGIGVGEGGGIGSGHGTGIGAGTGGGFGGGIFRVGNGVTAPRAIFSPEPEYSDEARKAKFQGMVTLLAVIGPDGRPKNLSVARSLGMGLDEKALAAVKTWKFQPGMKDGHPVAVQISIEVNFHLY